MRLGHNSLRGAVGYHDALQGEGVGLLVAIVGLFLRFVGPKLITESVLLACLCMPNTHSNSPSRSLCLPQSYLFFIQGNFSGF